MNIKTTLAYVVLLTSLSGCSFWEKVISDEGQDAMDVAYQCSSYGNASPQCAYARRQAEEAQKERAEQEELRRLEDEWVERRKGQQEIERQTSECRLWEHRYNYCIQEQDKGLSQAEKDKRCDSQRQVYHSSCFGS